MSHDKIWHARLCIVSQSRMIPLDADDKDAIEMFRVGVDAALEEIRNGQAAVRGAEGLMLLDRINMYFHHTYNSLHDDELRELVHTQWCKLRDNGDLP